MLKCAILADFLDFKTVAATLTQLHPREEKRHWFLAVLLKNIHYFIGLNTSLSYIRMVMGEKLYVTRHANRDLLGSYVITSELTF